MRNGHLIITALNVLMLFSFCSSPPEHKGTRAMVDSLARIVEEAKPEDYFYLNTAYAEELRKQLSGVPYSSPNNLRMVYAYNLIYAGKIEEGIEELEKIVEARFSDGMVTFLSKPYFEMLGIAYLRLGELENCIVNHTSESCLIPIQGQGIHLQTYGSENSIKYFTKILEADNYDLQARWLLNLAYMTLGRHPEDVPKKFLISDTLFASEYDIPRFPDRAISLGVDHTALAGGSILDDFNNDGFLDIFCTSWGLNDPVRLWLADGKGNYVDHTDDSGLNGIVSGLNCLQADFNNDGLVDILILRGGWLVRSGFHPNSLLMNVGEGRFVDVTIESGIYSAFPTQVGVWSDFNKDGWLDVFIGNEWYPSELYISNGDGTFSNKAAEWGVDVEALVKGAAVGDVNNDGLPDLYVSTLTDNNYLFLNEGSSFRDITMLAGVSKPDYGFPVWFWDYDHDGWDDIFVSGFKISGSGTNPIDMFKNITSDVASDYLGISNFAEYPMLFRNRGDNTFEDVTEKMGLNTVLYTMGSNFGDLDNDGFLDFYSGTGAPDFTSQVPNRMFRNDSARRFQDVTTAGGFGQIQKGHGISWGDLDNDGDQDIYTTIGGAVEGDVYGNMLLENPGFGNNWIELKFEGVEANRSAIGTRIEVHVVNDDATVSIFYHTVSSGGSFGANSLDAEIGLGKANDISKVIVTWPDKEKSIQEFTDLEMNQAYYLKQGETARLIEKKQFSLSGSSTSHSHH